MTDRLPSDALLLPVALHEANLDLLHNRIIVDAWVGSDGHRRYLSYPLPADLAQDMVGRAEAKFPVEDDDLVAV